MDKAQQLTMQPNISQETVRACAFTGHRTLESDLSEAAIVAAVETLVQGGAEVFYNGMAVGFDLLAAEIVLRLKKRYPEIRLVACVPFYGQEKYYAAKEKARYAEILKNADEAVILSENYYKGCMLVRDRYMADRADALIAYCKKATGGTAYTVGYFQKKYPARKIFFL